MKNSDILLGNKKPAQEGGFDVSVELGSLARTDTDKRIISFLIVSSKTINKTLSSAQKCCEKHSCGCFVEKSKSIRVICSDLTPTEPNWTDKPAVINNVDIQHLSGRSLMTGCYCV